MKAIKVVSQGKAEVQEVPLPKLRDDYVLVKVKDVALNPTDWYVSPSMTKGSNTESSTGNIFIARLWRNPAAPLVAISQEWLKKSDPRLKSNGRKETG